MSDQVIWLMASAVLGRPVPVDESYPHVHHDKRCGMRGCAACVEVRADDGGPMRYGIGGCLCRPAGRGIEGDTWSCPRCGADWRVVTATKASVTTRTWGRA